MATGQSLMQALAQCDLQNCFSPTIFFLIMHPHWCELSKLEHKCEMAQASAMPKMAIASQDGLRGAITEA